MYNSLYNSDNYWAINQLKNPFAIHCFSVGFKIIFMSNYMMYNSVYNSYNYKSID